MKRGLKELNPGSFEYQQAMDAGITPMKRGLKAGIALPQWLPKGRCRDYPDEKGTESVATVILDSLLMWDAGITPMKRGLKGRIGEGELSGAVDAGITPMKRGLKATNKSRSLSRRAWMQGLPR